jgi:hypothetical protein
MISRQQSRMIILRFSLLIMRNMVIITATKIATSHMCGILRAHGPNMPRMITRNS